MKSALRTVARFFGPEGLLIVAGTVALAVFADAHIALGAYLVIGGVAITLGFALAVRSE